MDRKFLIQTKLSSLKRSVRINYRLTYILWLVAVVFIIIVTATQGFKLQGQPFGELLKNVWPSLIPFSGSGYLLNIIPQTRERIENLEYFHNIVEDFHKLSVREQELIDSQIFIKR
ncbi:MAG: hypothetical protein WDN26_02500 [Chitinophagaceae bacterium]